MLARTKAETASIDIEFHLPGGSQCLRVEADTARLLFAVIEKIRLNGEKAQDQPVDAMPFAQAVEKRVGGTAALALRAYRNRLGMSQAEVASLSGLHASHLSAMESGKRKVTAKTAKRLAVVLKCDWRKIFIESE